MISPSDKHAALKAKYDPAPALAQMQSPNRDERLAGLRWMMKQACAGGNVFTDDWLRDPQTIAAHLPLLDDPDPEVAGEAVNNVRLLMPDPPLTSPFDAAVRLMHSDRPKTRSAAVIVAAASGGERVLDEALLLFADRDKSVRACAINEVANRCIDWSGAAKARLSEAAEKALDDRTDEVRCAGAGLLAMIAGKTALKAIKEAKKKCTHSGWRREFAEIIQQIERREA